MATFKNISNTINNIIKNNDICNFQVDVEKLGDYIPLSDNNIFDTIKILDIPIISKIYHDMRLNNTHKLFHVTMEYCSLGIEGDNSLTIEVYDREKPTKHLLFKLIVNPSSSLINTYHVNMRWYNKYCCGKLKLDNCIKSIILYYFYDVISNVELANTNDKEDNFTDYID